MTGGPEMSAAWDASARGNVGNALCWAEAARGANRDAALDVGRVGRRANWA